MVVKRFEIWLVNLEPVRGSEISKKRPCIVISPDVANKFLHTVTVAALITTAKPYPTRVDCLFKQKRGQVALDQIRSVDQGRLIKKLGTLEESVNRQICNALVSLFAY